MYSVKTVTTHKDTLSDYGIQIYINRHSHFYEQRFCIGLKTNSQKSST